MQDLSNVPVDELSEAGSAGQQLNLRHYWYVMLERRWLVIITFTLVMAGCAAYLVFAPRLYSGTVRIQIDRESEGALSLRDVVNGMGTDQDYLQTQYKILGDQSLLEAVVKHQKLADDPRYAKEFDLAKALAEDITISPVRLTRLVDVKARHTNAKKAVAIVSDLAETYVQQNFDIRNKKNTDSRMYLKSEVDRLGTALDADRDALQNYVDHTKFISFDPRENVNIIAEALTRSQASYSDARGRSEAASTLVTELAAHISSNRPLETFPSIANDPQVKQLQLQLASLENELAGLKQRYKDKMPQVQQVQSRIDESRHAIQRESERIVESLAIDAKVSKAQEASLKLLVGAWEANQADYIKARIEYDKRAQRVEISNRMYQTAMAKLKEMDLLSADKANNVSIRHKPEPAVKPDWPNIPIVAVLGLVLATVTAMGLALFVNFLDDSVKSQDDVETYLRVPFLGYIPNMRSNSIWERYLFAQREPKSNAAESYRSVRAAISLGTHGPKLRMITVTSTLPGEGKSLAASNLAIVMAQTGLRTLLVDADLRRPWVYKAFSMDPTPDLAAYLSGQVADIAAVIKKSEIPNLDVICASGRKDQPSELLSSRRSAELLDQLRGMYDRVIIDCPPVSAVSDPLVLSAAADGVLFVVKFNKVSREHARNSIQRLQSAGASVVGAVLNDIDFDGRDAYYYSYYNYQNRYYSGYESDEEADEEAETDEEAVTDSKV